ncbi:progranulin-like isoform X2 [Mastacembelus armatus]|uniref:Progranulin-like n=2 Tax=Mastacembelus armatus TaxID=205130 RepID=A0A7N8XJ67_9TELE|nr:progranulin-like isoform X2 [Mastacembelus armatus]
MFRISLCLLVGVLVWDFASCSVKCPDGKTCSDSSTCCKSNHGYSCCLYPKAVCCSDLVHCCPSGFRCNLDTQMCDKVNEPWMRVPMVKKEAAEESSAVIPPESPGQELESNHVPEEEKSSVVFCDFDHYCPSSTTCCKHPTGTWFCCPHYPGRCCLDGFHCCPFGYDCDLTYTFCLKGDLRFPFTPKQALSSVPASLVSTLEDKPSFKETPMTALTEASGGAPEAGVIRCDSKSYCSPGTTCCKGQSTGQWNCCPYPLGQCCADGRHCCEYGYACDPSSLSCRRWYSQVPSGAQEDAKTD